MRPPAPLDPWLPLDALKIWVQEAQNPALYRRRLALLMTAQQHHAPVIAAALDLSARTVRRLVERYNRLGPSEFDPQGWGGRRWGYLTPSQETEVLKSLERQARQGRVLTRLHIRKEVEDRIGHPVSLTYLSELLHRGRWRKLTPRPLHQKADPEIILAFKKNSPLCFVDSKPRPPKASMSDSCSKTKPASA